MPHGNYHMFQLLHFHFSSLIIAWERQWRMAEMAGPLHTCRRSARSFWFLALAWTTSGCHGHLKNEHASKRAISHALSSSFCDFDFQNKYMLLKRISWDKVRLSNLSNITGLTNFWASHSKQMGSKDQILMSSASQRSLQSHL